MNYCESPHWEKLELPQRLIDIDEGIKTNDFGILGGLIRDAKNVIVFVTPEQNKKHQEQ